MKYPSWLSPPLPGYSGSRRQHSISRPDDEEINLKPVKGDHGLLRMVIELIDVVGSSDKLGKQLKIDGSTIRRWVAKSKTIDPRFSTALEIIEMHRRLKGEKD
jgi:hypothetical protein